jgi:hypothetical protein
LAGLLGLALLVRLLCFTGMALGDDVFYATQAVALAESGSWPPEPHHWQTRLGMVLPTALAIKLLGPRPIAFVLWPLLLSTASVLVCFRLARYLAGERVAWLAALLQAAYPLEVIYATHLFPDIAVGLFSVLSLWHWLRALRDDRIRDYLWCGAWFAAAYLCRETVLLLGPVYLALWGLSGRFRRPRLPWVFLIPCLVLVLECGLYAATTGSALYRWNAIHAQQQDPGNLDLVRTPLNGGNFWTDPLLMLVASKEFGLTLVVAVAAGVTALWKWPGLRPLAAWLIVGFLWLYFGPTSLNEWLPLPRDPRYAAALTTPAVILVARALLPLRPTLRWAAAALLVGVGLFGAGLDQGSSIRAPHRAFVASAYAADATLEPFEYVGARWEQGLAQTPPFRCAGDRGRGSVVTPLRSFPHTTIAPVAETRYFVFSPARRADLLEQMTAEGWTPVDEFPGTVTPSRALIARVLASIPSQQERARRLSHAPGLLVLRNPRLADTDDATTRATHP